MKIFTPDDKEEYETLWAKHGGSVLQSWQWGDVKSGSGDIIRAKIGSYPVTIQIKSVPKLGWKFGYIPHGGPAKFFTKDTGDELKQLCDEQHLTHLLIDPYAEFDEAPEGFERSGQPWVQSQDTIITDLDRPEDDMQSAMRKKHRQYIRKSEKIGLFFETEDSMEGVRRLGDVMSRQFTTKSYLPYSTEYFEKIWKVFEGSDKVHIHIAMDAAEDVGAYMVIDGSDTTFQFYGGTTEIGRDKYAAYMLTWNSMLAAKARGVKKYDQWGTSPHDGTGFDKSDEKYGISVFKDGFTGEYVHYGDQLVVVDNKTKYKAYKRLIGLHRGIISLKKKL